jgi:hypothetical protein
MLDTGVRRSNLTVNQFLHGVLRKGWKVLLLLSWCFDIRKREMMMMMMVRGAGRAKNILASTIRHGAGWPSILASSYLLQYTG